MNFNTYGPYIPAIPDDGKSPRRRNTVVTATQPIVCQIIVRLLGLGDVGAFCRRLHSSNCSSRGISSIFIQLSQRFESAYTRFLSFYRQF